MRDKLYKTNKKVTFYRLRSAFIAIVFIAVGAAALTLPYEYVAQAINAYQEKKEESSAPLVSEHLEVEPTSN